MIEFARIHHVSIAVRDLERSRVFYSEVLKLPRLERPPFNSKGVWYAIGDQQLHLIEHPRGETLRTGEIDSTDGHYSLWVKSYSQTIDFLNANGIPYDARPESLAGFAQIYILDPDHNIIELDSEYNS